MPIQPVEKIWMDGELVDWQEAKVHVLTHALHYGSGVFEGIRAYETKRGAGVFRLTDHIRRLFRSAAVYQMEIPFTIEELVEATRETVRANGLFHSPGVEFSSATRAAVVMQFVFNAEGGLPEK